jgi:hypothetical protein
MGVFKTADGRTLVGIGQQDGNEYSGFNGWRDCVIQLTASGATENSVKYLNAIKDYAIAHNAKGESIMPPNLSVWVSNNGATTAVQADDIAVDGENVTICGIKWNGTAWDYTDAGKGGGGGGASSLADLSDVSIAAPQPDQALTYNAESREWENKKQIGAIRFPFDDDGVVTAFNDVLAFVKGQAKSAGSSGTKIDYVGAGVIGNVLSVANRNLTPYLAIGRANNADLYYFAGGSVSKVFASFAADQIDADGTYHVTISFAETYAMISATYVSCPAMG